MFARLPFPRFGVFRKRELRAAVLFAAITAWWCAAVVNWASAQPPVNGFGRDLGRFALIAGPAGEPLPQHVGGIQALALSRGGDVLVTAGADRTVRFFRLTGPAISKEEQEARQALLKDLDSSLFSVRDAAHRKLKRIGPTIQPLLQAHLQKTRSPEVRHRLKALLKLFEQRAEQRHERAIRDLAISPDGRRAVSVGRDSRAIIWSTDSSQPIRVFSPHADGVWATAYSPDGRLLATGGGDQKVRLWDADTGDERAVFAGHRATIHGLAFSPDGTLLASAGSFDRTVRIWDLKSGKEQAAYQDGDDAKLCVAFSRGNRLAYSGYGGGVYLRSPRESKPIKIETGLGTVRAIAFSRDAALLAAGGDSGRLKIYRGDNGKPLAELPAHREALTGLVFLPDGRLASCGLDGAVRFWKQDKGGWRSEDGPRSLPKKQ